MDKQIFITGANGQLGTALRKQYPNAQFADVSELDITNQGSVANFGWSSIDVLINAAAYTNVDGAETAEGRVAAWKVNATALAYLAEAAQKHDLTLIHISSDYVFDGEHKIHTEDEPLSPLSVYGASKAAGDLLVAMAPKHYLIRTSWVIGEGKNFVRTMLELSKKDIEPTVVSDQIGRLTFTSELVRAIDHLLGSSATFGTYNVSNDGDPVSWADITREIYQLAGKEHLSVSNTSTEEYFAGKRGVAPRPLQSTLSLAKIQATDFVPTDWRDDLVQYIQDQSGDA